MSLLLNDPLDVLHRFTPTPFQSEVYLGGKLIRAESNDRALLPPGVPQKSTSPVSSRHSFSWKLIRDPKAPGRLESPTKLSIFDTVFAVFMGSACLIAVDLEESQLVSFIGSQVDTGEYQDRVLPILCELSDMGLNDNRI
jgi:hypothetical protein